MKTYIYNVCMAALLLVGFTACEDFLTEDLKGDYTSETFYTSEANAIEAVNGVYNGLYGNTQWIFGDVASDDAVKGGNAGDQADIVPIDDFTAAADNGVISNYWTHTYEIITRANTALAKIGGMNSSDISEDMRTRLMAECKFLRAYAYFQLVNVFGEVPLKLQPQTTSSAIHVGLSSVADIYVQIENDLKEAAAVLPASYSLERGRATKGAAYGLLAKVELFQQKYDLCLQHIDSLDNAAAYDLVGNYANLFAAGAEDSVEVVFCISYVRNEVVSMGNNLAVWLAPAYEGGYYFDAPTQNYVDIFNEQTADGNTDPRLDASIGRDGQPWFNGLTFSKSWSEATGYLVKKYNEDMSEDYAKSESTIPQHILRYADVLLMKAEALNESGQTPTAAAALDRVRSRAGLAATTAASQADLRDAIRLERRRELGFEFHRFFDVMRYGKDYAVAALGAAAWPSNRYYYPIPQTELDANQALQ